LIDLNHILLFIAIVSPLILLARLSRMRTGRQRGWKIAAAIVLGGAGFSWALVPSLAGFVGGTLWGLLLLLPSIAERSIDALLLEKRFGRARNLAVVRRIFHPWDDSPYRPSLLRCLELARAGRMNAALDQLATERSDGTLAGRFATALTFAFTENWPGLVQWCRRDISVTAEPAIRTLYLRALGETAALDELVCQFAARNQSPESRLTNSPQFAIDLAYVLAFCGRTRDLVRLLERDLAKLARDHQQFWIATAELAEGNTSAAIHRLENLRGATRDATLQRASERRLAHAKDSSTARLSSSSQALLTCLRADTVGPPKSPANRSTRGAPAVWTLILLNVAMFAVEFILGGSTNGQTLHNLGALEPDSVIVRHEYWRLLAALFLHYGLLHILFNLYALYLLGPALERIIGSIKFAVSYLISGLGSSAGVVLLRVLGLTNADQLVGASGCVMGVIGVSAGLLLRHRQSPLAGRRLRNIIVIVALQTAFDLSTPQVSLAAHLSGLITGVGVGTILASTRCRLTTP
jgi:rhomboid protease GluP